jgi:hypothetical protein
MCNEGKEYTTKDGDEDSSVDIVEIYDKANKEKHRGKITHDSKCPFHPRAS